MAEIKISALPELTSADNDDVFPIVDTSVGVTKKIQKGNVVTDATLTAKGVVEEATAAEIDAGTQAGATGAELAVNPKYLNDSIYKSQLPTADEKANLPSIPNKVNLTGNETIADIKTFGSIPVLPASDPTTDNQAVRKAYVDGKMVYKNGSTTYDISTATGTQNIAHGLGKIPKKVRITFMRSNNAEVNILVLSYNGTTMSCVSYGGLSAEKAIDNFRFYGDGSSKYTTGTITFDATNIIVSWVKTSTPIGILQIMWEAE